MGPCPLWCWRPLRNANFEKNFSGRFVRLEVIFISDFVVTTAQLADIFQLSERRIQQLCAAGVIDSLPGSRAKRFDLETVVGQYAGFLMLRALDDSVTVDSWTNGGGE